jgi:non-ribosomal peptide synthetase component F
LSSQNTSSQERFSLINITVLVRNGQLGFDVSYHNKILKQHLITRWIDEYVACLQEAAAILPTLSPTYTPSDFPLLRTSHEELQVLLEDRLPSLGIDIEAVDDLSLCSPTQIDMVEDEENAIGHHVTRLNFEVTVTTSREAIDLDRFSTAFAELVKRHPILRTVFIPPSQSDGQFIQVVLKQFTPDIIHATVDEFSNEPEYTDTVYKKFYRGEPPYQLTCCHVLARNMIFLSIDISHTLIDGASMAILIHDWNLAYQGKLPNGIPPSFQSLIRLIQYRASQGPTSYWTQHLQGIQPCLLPCHRSDLIGERQQRYVRLKLPAIHILQKVCQLISITIPNLFHSIWSIVLHLATKSNHVVFGYLVSGRDVPLAGIEDAVGPYFNLLVSQYKINPEQTIRTVLQTVQATMTERLPFQNFSWPEMRHVVGFAAKTPVFNTLINIHRFAPLKSREKKQLNFTARNGYDPLAVSKFFYRIPGTVELTNQV